MGHFKSVGNGISFPMWLSRTENQRERELVFYFLTSISASIDDCRGSSNGLQRMEIEGWNSVWQSYWVHYMTQKDNLDKWLAFSWKYQENIEIEYLYSLGMLEMSLSICLGFVIWSVGFFVKDYFELHFMWI